MPGSIKIDDGSGNYTILTNAGSLGSDKTLTVPNSTGTLATTTDVNNVTPGIVVADQWRLTADLVGSNGDITSNLEQVDTAGQATIGSAMTESSGIFTFPQTGIYHVVMSCRIFSGSDTFTSVTMSVTTDNSSYTEIARNGDGDAGAGGSADLGSFIDVTDTSLVKVKFGTDSFASGSKLLGSSTSNQTTFTFIRLGDT